MLRWRVPTSTSTARYSSTAIRPLRLGSDNSVISGFGAVPAVQIRDSGCVPASPEELFPQSDLVLHFNVTAHPTSIWTAQQLVEALPFASAPEYG